MDFISDFEVIMGLCAIVCFLLLGLFYRIYCFFRPNQDLVRRVEHGHWISCKHFLKNWIIERQQGTKQVDGLGYKYVTRTGCYVIKTWQGIGPFRWDKHCYVGQSNHITNRVHNHISGKGSGDVYHDVREGLHCKMRFVCAPKRKLNVLEKQLIERYHATESYNRTSGGGVKRHWFS